MVACKPKRLYELFRVSKEDCMNCYSLLWMTILVIYNIEVKQKQFSSSEKRPHWCSYVLKVHTIDSEKGVHFRIPRAL